MCGRGGAARFSSRGLGRPQKPAERRLRPGAAPLYWYVMLSSRDRILTTHVGSLPRNETLSDLLIRREEGEAVDPRELEAEMDRAVRHVVEKQAQAGIDIANDGEQQRVDRKSTRLNSSHLKLSRMPSSA